MRVIDGVVGSIEANVVLAAAKARHEAAGTLETVELSAAERSQRRVRTTTDHGRELGIIAERGPLSGGDVLLDEQDCFILVSYATATALAVALEELESADVAELGHRLGSANRDVAVDSGALYVELDTDRQYVERVVEEIVPDATTRVGEVKRSRFDDRERSGGSDRANVYRRGEASAPLRRA